MQRLGEWLVTLCCKAGLYAALIVAPKPRAPADKAWTVQINNSNYSAEVWFIPGQVWLGGWHVMVWLDYGDERPLLVDSGGGRCWIQPMQADSLPRVREMVQPEYVVTVCAPLRSSSPTSSIGPVTCVHLAKRLVGIDRPGVVTSRQLLSLLWSMRHGS